MDSEPACQDLHKKYSDYLPQPSLNKIAPEVLIHKQFQSLITSPICYFFVQDPCHFALWAFFLQ